MSTEKSEDLILTEVARIATVFYGILFCKHDQNVDIKNPSRFDHESCQTSYCIVFYGISFGKHYQIVERNSEDFIMKVARLSDCVLTQAITYPCIDSENITFL